MTTMSRIRARALSIFMVRASRPGASQGNAGSYVKLPAWPRRHPVISSLAIAALAAVLAGTWHTWIVSSPCGPGMSATGSPWTCVGLDLNSTPMRGNDPLFNLERMIARMNSRITGPVATIVLLEDLTPDPAIDTQQLQSVRHTIEGAITGVQRANATAVAGGQVPQIELLLANFGSAADQWRQAVTAIEDAQKSDHIVAVTGIGQSVNNTRAAVAALSAHGITSIGADVTADNMNEDLASRRIPGFFRVAPTNTDEVAIAVSYIQSHFHHPKAMLVQDTNRTDSYALTLATAFQSKFGDLKLYQEYYRSPPDRLIDISRYNYMITVFAQMHTAICSWRPDLIYFAGRGIDLMAFLEALATGSSCGLPKVTIMTGDDASNIVGVSLPGGGDASFVTVLFTALATSNEWSADSGQAAAAQKGNYQDFAGAFGHNGFSAADLADGEAIMNYDAVLTAALAIRNDPYATKNPETVASFVLGLHDDHAVHGASGLINICPNGNPADKVMPILQIEPDGSTRLEQSPPVPTEQINNKQLC